MKYEIIHIRIVYKRNIKVQLKIAINIAIFIISQLHIDPNNANGRFAVSRDTVSSAQSNVEEEENWQIAER